MKRIISLFLVMVLATLSLCSCSSEEMGVGACEYLESRDISGRDIHYVEICVKNYGKMVILLDATTAPETVANFLNLVESGFYDGLTFHRIIEGFMIQGGDPDANGKGGSEENIFGEFMLNGYYNDISHKRGVISMARSDSPNSASSQFFICHEDCGYSLDGSYASFGYVVEGLSVVDDIVNGTMEKCQDYFGNTFYSWLYYGNGSLTRDDSPIRKLQPKISYIKILDSWEEGGNA